MYAYDLLLSGVHWAEEEKQNKQSMAQRWSNDIVEDGIQESWDSYSELLCKIAFDFSETSGIY